jgi:hypothetical protein
VVGVSDARVLRMPGADEPSGTDLAVIGEGASWAEQVGQALEFLRRRALGQYEVDEFGFDPELNDSVLLAALRPLYTGSGSRSGGSRTCRLRAAPSWWPTMPARSGWML